MVAIESAHLVGAGGALGALCRHYLSGAVQREPVPLGTLTVNAVGSFVLGLVTFAGVTGDAALLVGVGACGSFTTFSSFSVETVRLWEDGYVGLAVGNAVGNLVCALAGIGLAWGLVRAV
ncbi:chromosome condensation protein CrcB [Haloarcula taiwanensis]|uniref:Fluoride-specific ion channel FluC n=1 Tax=Haloarcula taiwanensis TaxID=1932004 RepID=A0A2H5A146_9EURY|nr:MULTISPECIES: fluoride efflux transporter CrcB [Haloarcula]AUG48441.1 chromosome condensation protein CrcB [Haloarcula taiwanensis]RLM39798.1 fluoride efflux transporter CrcB [Haloarcula sp. Atlit-120R]RLM47772.1 fluoride efflux transporter CrcB [Haloarcula sp. Atlit-47R]RLM97016.1 fluoride efflux transporter CrcB [Haloarcula sp. Atlit-7R]